MNSRGFTLLELVVVIVLIGVLSVIAASRFDRRPFDTRAAASELVEAIRYAQTMTMAQGGISNYTVQIQANGYSVLRDGAPARDPFGNGGSYATTWFNVAISPVGTIGFSARGRPQCGGGLACGAAAQVIDLSIGSVETAVRLEPVTGYVR